MDPYRVHGLHTQILATIQKLEPKETVEAEKALDDLVAALLEARTILNAVIGVLDDAHLLYN